eukprot:scaffold330081_cov91-Tisochrysis_lutea.AAC.2
MPSAPARKCRPCASSRRTMEYRAPRCGRNDQCPLVQRARQPRRNRCRVAPRKPSEIGAELPHCHERPTPQAQAMRPPQRGSRPVIARDAHPRTAPPSAPHPSPRGAAPRRRCRRTQDIVPATRRLAAPIARDSRHRTQTHRRAAKP